MTTEHTRGREILCALGAAVRAGLSYCGGLTLLAGSTLRWTLLGLFTPKERFPFLATIKQMHRIGVRGLPIVVLAQLTVGAIIALQMIPALQPWGQEGSVANIIAVAGFRLLGPFITAIVLAGFAGASIAAELGTMVASEEIEAMQAMAMNPVRYLVVPRVTAAALVTVLLTVLGDLLIALGGYTASRLVLESSSYIGYWDRMREQLGYLDFATGLIQAGIFGLLISLIACHEGLRVRGGAEGVGRATTMTVVYSIVAVIFASGLCTMVFYVFDL